MMAMILKGCVQGKKWLVKCVNEAGELVEVV